jgi:hypothetical protein
MKLSIFFLIYFFRLSFFCRGAGIRDSRCNCLRRFQNKKAEKIPTAPNENNNMDIALMAINYLLYVRDPAPFVEFVTRVKSHLQC